MDTVIRNAKIVNEGRISISDVLIRNGRIDRISPQISITYSAKEINAAGMYLLPGIIDAHVHFRDPGFPYKGTIRSESIAALAGGVTSFMDMPNTKPPTLTQELLEQKYRLAGTQSFCNYSYFMGISQNNFEEALKTDPEKVCGISDDGLYFDDTNGILAGHPQFLEKLFARSPALVALHSEEDIIIRKNEVKFKAMYGEEIPPYCHPLIRSSEACLESTARLIEIASRYNARLHLLHISTEREASLFDNASHIRDKLITAEVCAHHLWFSDEDYLHLGSKIKWNPAIKTKADRDGLLKALLDNRIDMIASDHAPHVLGEKLGSYFNALPGGPLVQHSLIAMLELSRQNKITIEKVVQKMSHNVAEVYSVKERGYIREGYFADLVLVDLEKPWKVSADNVLYKCGWSPFEGQQFNAAVMMTFVNGHLSYNLGKICGKPQGQRLLFVPKP